MTDISQNAAIIAVLFALSMICLIGWAVQRMLRDKGKPD